MIDTLWRHGAYVFKTTDYGKTWAPLVTPQDAKGVRGYAHVIKEDLVKPDLLFLGTEFGLWVSIDGGKNWAQFKGSRFRRWPFAIWRFNRAITIWFWRHTAAGSGSLMTLPVAGVDPGLVEAGSSVCFRASSSAAHRRQRRLGERRRRFCRRQSARRRGITYYQRTRHLFGKLKIEVLDSSGRVVDEIPASKRPGLNRVTWSMREKPPRVPPAAQIAFAGIRGPRLVAGRLHCSPDQGRQSFGNEIDGWSRSPGQIQRGGSQGAVRRSHESACAFRRRERTNGPRSVVSRRLANGCGLPEGDRCEKQLTILTESRRGAQKIVATTEGGAITGEERLREHTDQLYGAIFSYEGKPGDYQIAYIDALNGN